MQLCRKCIIPDTFPGVTFEDGICGFCRVEGSMDKINKDLLGEEALIEKIRSNSGGGRGVSGSLSLQRVGRKVRRFSSMETA